MAGDRYFISDQNGLHFLTFTAIDWLDIFTRPIYKQIVVNDLNYCIQHKGLEVFAWCLMTNHMHLLARTQEGYKLSDIIRDFKKHTAITTIEAIKQQPESRREWLLERMILAGKADMRITKYKFWQEDNHAVLLHPSETIIIEQKLDYIHQNPVKEGIVAEAQHYLYSSAVDYSGGKGLVKICFL